MSVDLNVQGGVGFETFHGALQPYGDWVVVGSYGRVWRPHVPSGWRPYYYGRWEWTNEGWLWVSDEPWGWAAYHYGRWAYDPYYGWLWVPGYEWAPAWVSWRASGDVIGWSPLAPGYSVYVSSYPFIDFWWTFVPSVRFVSVPVYSVAYAPGHARRWYDSTAPAPARPPRGGGYQPGAAAPAWGGPAPRLIEQRIGRPVTPARIVRAPSPGERGRPGEIPVYRPERRGGEERFPVRSGPPGRDDRAAPGGYGRGGPAAAAPAPATSARAGPARRSGRARWRRRLEPCSEPRWAAAGACTRTGPARRSGRARRRERRRLEASPGRRWAPAAGAAAGRRRRPWRRPCAALRWWRRRARGPGRRPRALTRAAPRPAQLEATRTVVVISRPVSRSRALIVRIPSTLTSKRISSLVSPARAGRTPLKVNSPRISFRAVSA